MQKQQKSSELDLKSKFLWDFLNQNTALLWSEGKRQVPNININDNILKALAFARRCGSLRVGLEQIQTILQGEETGLVAMKKLATEKTIDPLNVSVSISRLMLLSNDGSERFYRHSETILNRYSHRLLGVKLDVSSSVLGELFYGKEKNKAVKALFIDRKDSVLRVMSSFIV